MHGLRLKTKESSLHYRLRQEDEAAFHPQSGVATNCNPRLLVAFRAASADSPAAALVQELQRTGRGFRRLFWEAPFFQCSVPFEQMPPNDRSDRKKLK